MPRIRTARTRTFDRVSSKQDPEGDPYWAIQSKPVLDFLTQPRSWTDLKDFAKGKFSTTDTLTNIVGWLQNRGLIRLLGKGREVYWLQTRLVGTAVSKIPDPEVPKPRSKKKSGAGGKGSGETGKDTDQGDNHHGGSDANHSNAQEDSCCAAHTSSGATE